MQYDEIPPRDDDVDDEDEEDEDDEELIGERLSTA
jgi:hypothetical protein